ncbi:MAG: HdeD family acid-resistance protein [Actinobacteria bacterium]|nr:HdeD family acid-resistance protein [Actinomycetota bacterium]
MSTTEQGPGQQGPQQQVEEQFVITEGDVLHAVGKAWWVVLVTGLLSILLGVLFLVWPGKTIVVIAIIFGVWLIVSGIVQLVQGFNSELSAGERTLAILVGAISIILGVLCFRGGIANGVYILSLFIGFSFLFRGIWQLIVGIQSKGKSGRGLLIFAGILGLIAGIIVLAAPFESLEILALIAGIWLVAMGLLEIVYSFSIKKASGN